jgi:hypothetical protein
MSTETIDERCAKLASEAEFHACAVAENDTVYGGEYGKIRIIILASKIESIRTQEADEYDDMLASFYACHPAD